MVGNLKQKMAALPANSTDQHDVLTLLRRPSTSNMRIRNALAKDKHPEWYPELSTKSTDKEIAKALYMPGPETI